MGEGLHLTYRPCLTRLNPTMNLSNHALGGITLGFIAFFAIWLYCTGRLISLAQERWEKTRSDGGMLIFCYVICAFLALLWPLATAICLLAALCSSCWIF